MRNCIAVTLQALQLAARSRGVFDPTYCSRWSIYGGLGTEASQRIPKQKDQNASEIGGLREVKAWEIHVSARLSGHVLRLSAIAKGHGVDKVVELLNLKG